jgi:WD40 repeat protein
MNYKMKNLKCLIIVVLFVSISGCATLGLQETSVSLQPKKTLRHLDAVSSLAFSPDGKFLASGNVISTVVLWELSNEKKLTEFKFKGFFASQVWNVIFSPDGRYLAAANNGNEIKVWEISTGKLINTFPSQKGLIIPPGGIRYTPDGKFLVVGNGWEKTISLWEISTGKLIYTVTHGGGRLPMDISIALSPDGKYLASGSKDRFIKLWEVSSGNLVSTLNTPSERITSLVFSPDGKYLVSGHLDGTISVWELSDGNGKLITTVKGHQSLRELTTSPDGKYLVSASSSAFASAIAFWELPTGKLIAAFKTNRPLFNCIAYSPDGKFLATGDAGGNVKLWDVDELIKIGLQGK